MQSEQMITRPVVLPAERASATLGYPTNRLTSLIDDWQSLTRAVQSLMALGVDPRAIEVLYGIEGIRRLGTTRGDGALARLSRRLPELGPERELIQAYDQGLRDGDAVIVLRQPDRALWPAIAETLHANGGRLTRFFGRFAVHVLAP